MKQGSTTKFRKLIGATLMEAILVAAIMGALMAYIGDMILKHSKENVLRKGSVKVIILQKALRKYASDVQWNLSSDASTGSKHMINPFLIEEPPEAGKVWINFADLEKKLKNVNCGAEFEIPADVIDNYLECNFNGDIYPVEALGAFVYFKPYKNISYPTVKRKISKTEMLYDIGDKLFHAEYFKLIEMVTNQVADDGYQISADNLDLTVVNEKNIIDRTNDISYTAFMSKTPLEINEYIQSIKESSDKNFAFLTEDNADLSENLKSDGSVTVNKGKALCWDTDSSTSVPCIRVVPDSVITDKEFFVTNTDMVFGGDKLKTAPKISYHVFKDGKNVLLPYMECLTEKGGVTLENKLVAIPSSFSSGSESGTNFSNPEQIVSKGTKGAGGNHAMVSGLSLQWEGIEADMQWSISGSVGIDAAFRSENNSSSVLRNPNSISFIAIQWCEEA